MLGAEPVRTAVVGLGWAGRTIWLPCLTGDPRFTVVAAVDPDERVRAETPLPADCARLDRPDGLSADAVDLAVVAVPNHLHAAVAAPLLARGISVFLEKPVCLSLAEAAQLRDAERAGGATLLAGSAARHRADVGELARLLPSLGPVRHLELSWIRARGIPTGDGWFTDRRRAGGGALVDLGWHLLDVGFGLLGGPGVRRVLGSVSADFLTRGVGLAAWRADAPQREGGADVEDSARVMLTTDDGVSILIRTGWASHQELDRTRITVEARDGTARLEGTFGFSPNRLPHSTLTVLREGVREQLPVPEDPIGAEYGRQTATLPAALADPRSRGRAVAEAERTLRVIERVYRTAPGFSPTAVQAVGRLSEVDGLEAEAAAAARGERFLLHAELPGDGRWPRTVSAVRLVLLEATGLAYGTGRPIVTVLEPLNPADRCADLARLARLLHDEDWDGEEIERARGRLARLSPGLGQAAPVILRDLRAALAFAEANGAPMTRIGRVVRNKAYVAGPPPASASAWMRRDRLSGRTYAAFAHAVAGTGLPGEATNPRLLRWRPDQGEERLRRWCADADPQRTPGRLLISVEARDESGRLTAAAGRLHEDGHRPAWLYRSGAGSGELDRLGWAADALARAGAHIAGVSIPAMGRQMEHVAAIAALFADRNRSR
jgi:oxidoreductase